MAFKKVGVNIIKHNKMYNFIKIILVTCLFLYVLNTLFVNMIYLLKKEEVDNVKRFVPIFNFECPAQYITSIIDYDKLTFAQRIFINKEDYCKINNDKQYLSLMIKLNLTYLGVNSTKFFYTNWDDHGYFDQGGSVYVNGVEFNYVIYTKSGVNVFTLQPEVKVFYFIGF